MLHAAIYLTILTAIGICGAMEHCLQPLHSQLNPTIGERVELQWQYDSELPLDSITFSRDRKNSDPDDIGTWSLKDGFQANRLTIATVLEFNIEKNGTREKINLVLTNPIYIDYDLTYYCKVTCEKENVHTSEISVIAKRPKVKASAPKVNNTQVEFVFEAKYKYKSVMAAFFRQSVNNETREYIGSMLWDIFKENTDDEHIKGGLTYEKIANGSGVEEHILTLLNTTTHDYGSNYSCYFIFSDGEESIKVGTVLEKEEVVTDSNKQIYIQPNSGCRCVMGFYISIYMSLFWVYFGVTLAS